MTKGGDDMKIHNMIYRIISAVAHIIYIKAKRVLLKLYYLGIKRTLIKLYMRYYEVRYKRILKTAIQRRKVNEELRKAYEKANKRREDGK